MSGRKCNKCELEAWKKDYGDRLEISVAPDSCVQVTLDGRDFAWLMAVPEECAC